MDSPGSRILVVEDSATQAERLKASLEARGFAVTTASDGVAGFAAARECRPDVIISDIIMPELDGYGMCRRIKDDEVLKDIPVILLTSLSDPQDVIRGLESGADGFVVKTDSDGPLVDCMARVSRTAHHAAGRPDPSGIRVRLAGNDLRIEAHPQRVFDFLISTYQTAYQTNIELLSTRKALGLLNEQLETQVKQRTAELEQANQRTSAAYQQLWHAAKLVTLGELAASLAHEINNPLQTVSLHIESLSARVSGDPAAREALSVVGRELERMARLVADMLQFSRRGEPQAQRVSPAEELEKTLGLLEYHLRKCGVQAKMDFQSGNAAVKADPEQLQQVFLNLMINACDAMPKGGTLTARVLEEGEVVIEIIDTGTGIPAEDLPRVMETFFTTKPPGKGTGLGLPICRNIIEAHRGRISIDSTPGRGTTVRIVLPNAEA